MKRRDFLKIPGLTTGILFGSVFLPPWSKIAFAAVTPAPLRLEGQVRIGFSRLTFPIPSFILKKIVRSGAEKAKAKVNQFSPLTKKIHHWVVKELAIRQRPISLSTIAKRFGVELSTVESIVNELEKEKTFLYRNNSKDINWAYPVTTERTPHRVTFGSGEKFFAAWAIDAIATPFVQGLLRQEKLNVRIDTKCAYSGRPIDIDLTSDLEVREITPGSAPYIFVPSVDVTSTAESSIIEIFWQQSVFFWSEEELKVFRSENKVAMGAYLSLKQAISITPIAQGSLFGYY